MIFSVHTVYQVICKHEERADELVNLELFSLWFSFEEKCITANHVRMFTPLIGLDKEEL